MQLCGIHLLRDLGDCQVFACKFENYNYFCGIYFLNERINLIGLKIYLQCI